jgi:hypothetical protein
MTAKLKSHPLADTYPMMSQQEMDALVEDIRANGQRQPIILYEGMILDGRNRYAACLKAEKEPVVQTFEGDEAAAMALVRSLNDLRREMTPGKWALVAARQWMLHDTRSHLPKSVVGNDTPKRNGVKSLAKHFRCSDKSIIQARDLLEGATDLVEEVESGRPLTVTYEVFRERAKKAAKEAQDMERIAEYREAVESGSMTFEDAMQKRVEEEREEGEKLASIIRNRETWLRELADMDSWFHIVSNLTDDYLRDHHLPDSPGFFDNGVSSENLNEWLIQLRRIQKAMAFHERSGKKAGTEKGKGKRS